MNVDIKDTSVLYSLAPMDIAAYLRSRSWSEVENWDNKASIWVTSSKEAEILLPFQKDLADFSLRMADVLKTLSRYEQRSQSEILHDLIVTSADVIRVRLISDNKSQTTSISLDDANVAIQSTKELMMAAACSAVEPRSYFPSKKFLQATNYTKKLRLGQTEPGSYVLTVISKVSPTLVRSKQEESPDVFPTEEPFERQVTTMLMSGLIAVRQAAMEAGMSGNIEPFHRAVEKGASANLCDSLLGFSGANRDIAFEISMSWSRSRPIPEQIQTVVSFSTDSLPIIEEAARIFKENSYQEEFDLIGHIIGLRRETELESGNVLIVGAVEGRARKVSITLDDKLYNMAIRAHENRSIIRVEGDLVKSGNQYRMLLPRHFQILNEDEYGT